MAMQLAMLVPMASNRLFKLIFDQEVVEEDPVGQKVRIFKFITTAPTANIAKVKTQIFVSVTMRPKRHIMPPIEVQVVEHGLILKKYLVTVKTTLFGSKEEGETVE